MPQLRLQVRRSTATEGGPVVWVSLDGFLDASTVLSFEHALELLHREEGGDVVLDFGHVLYANSTAIGTILNYRNLLLQEGRELFLIKVVPEVWTTFDLLGLTAIVPCLPDEGSATRYLRSAPVGERDPEAFASRRGPSRPARVPDAAPRPRPGPPPPPGRRNVMMIAPEENRFTDITTTSTAWCSR